MRLRLLCPFLLVLMWLASCGNKENKFTVNGKISNMPVQNVFLEELNPITDVIVIDSGRTDEKGNFELTGTAPEPGLYRLRFEQDQFILLSLDKGVVKVTGDWSNLDNYKVAGSAASAGLRQFLITVREHLRDFNTMSVVLDTLQARGNDSMLTQAKSDLQEMNISFTRYIEQYADTTKYLPNALFAVQMLNPAVEGQYLQVFTQNLGSRFPSSRLAKDFTVKLNKMMAGISQPQPAQGVQVGAVAPEITLPDAEGKQVSLSSFKGRYVLVDFWASWCGPCRGENPNVVAAYNKFKDRNFTVLGVSLDSDKDKWNTAIRKDNLTWTHISDLKGWESIAARDYYVESIPANFLVDPEGKVVARDLRGEALEAKLGEILK